MKDVTPRMTLRLVDRYDHDRTADVRAHADRSGRLWITRAQLLSAELRARIAAGSYLVCVTAVEQCEIDVYNRDGSLYGIVYCTGGYL